MAAAVLAAAVVLAGCGADTEPTVVSAPAPSLTAPSMENSPPAEAVAPSTLAAAAGSTVGRSLATVPPPSAPITPVRIEVAGTGIDAPVEPVGVRLDGQMDLPPNPDVMGWYRFGPSPGHAAGSVVLGGHLDSRTYGVGQLARLRDVEVGARITVELDNGGVAAYTVTAVERFEKPALPLGELFRRDGNPVLVLVTCGGDFDVERGGYQENLVVTADPV